MKTHLNRVLTICLFVALLIVSVKYYIKIQDGYHLVDYSISPDGKHVGIIVANMGGGGPGYCRDLIYKFPKKDFLPDFSKEKKNKKFLIKELNCGEAKKLNWNSEKLVIN